MIKIFVIFLMTATSFSSELRSFDCTTKLDYFLRINSQKKVVKTVDFSISGARTDKDTLRGGAWVSAGSATFTLGLPSYYLSDDVVTIKGFNLKDQAGVTFRYLRNSNGTQNSSNSATVKIKNSNGRFITASNKKLSLGRSDLGHYDINCEIEK